MIDPAPKRTPHCQEIRLKTGKHRLTINKESWSRIMGLDMDTLRSGIKEVKKQRNNK
jgi:hypothetical protein